MFDVHVIYFVSNVALGPRFIDQSLLMEDNNLNEKQKSYWTWAYAHLSTSLLHFYVVWQHWKNMCLMMLWWFWNKKAAMVCELNSCIEYPIQFSLIHWQQKITRHQASSNCSCATNLRETFPCWSNRKPKADH